MKRTHPGRPPLDDEEASVPVCVKMTTTQYDHTYLRAQRARVSIPEQIRRDIRRREAAEKRYLK